jgi:hypothetical protein
MTQVKPFRGMQPNRTHPLQRVCKGLWLFNEGTGNKVWDYSGNRNTGIITNATWVGGELNFVSNAYVNFGNNSSLSDINKVTVIAKIKIPSQDAACIVSKYDTGFNKRVWAIRSSGASDSKMQILLSSTGATLTKSYISSIVIGDSSYHTVGFTYFNNTLKLYIDGVLDPNPTKSTDTAMTTLYNADNSVYIGCLTSSGSPVNLLNGLVVWARICNDELTPASMSVMNREPYADFVEDN